MFLASSLQDDPRSKIFAGHKIRLPACVPIQTLINDIHERLVKATGCDEPSLALRVMSTAELWDRLGDLRREIASDAWDHYTAAIIPYAGIRSQQLLIDGLRLRVVVPAHLRTPQMEAAYLAHRDTWFANPRQQINLWIPLTDISKENGFAFYPEAFGRAISNTSNGFHFVSFAQMAGWQGAKATKEKGKGFYPSVLEALPEAQTFELARGEAFLFSAAHLHQTTPNMTGSVRYSLDVRFVDPGDVLAGHGAPDIDNASEGEADLLKTYREVKLVPPVLS